MKKSQKKSTNKTAYELSWDDIPTIKPVCLELGYNLIHMVEKSSAVLLLNSIHNVREKLSTELGFLIPTVCVQKNLDFASNEYRISIKKICVGTGEVHPKCSLAINPGQKLDDLEGIKVVEPAYELDAIWIVRVVRKMPN